MRAMNLLIPLVIPILICQVIYDGCMATVSGVKNIAYKVGEKIKNITTKGNVAEKTTQ